MQIPQPTTVLPHDSRIVSLRMGELAKRPLRPSPPPTPTFLGILILLAPLALLLFFGEQQREQQVSLARKALLDRLDRSILEKKISGGMDLGSQYWILMPDGRWHLGLYSGPVASPDELPREGNVPGDLRASLRDGHLWLFTRIGGSSDFAWVDP